MKTTVKLTVTQLKELRRILRIVRDSGRTRLGVGGGYSYIHNPDFEIASELLSVLRTKTASGGGQKDG